MQQRLKGKVAIITGGARGQGLEHAWRLAREGAAIMIADVLDSEGTAAADCLNKEGFTAVYEKLDVTDASAWARVVEVAEAVLGPVTTLVNNAGISSKPSLSSWSTESWASVVAVNQTGVALGMQAVIPGMERLRSGSIINVSSAWAHSGGDGSGSVGYVATKAAVLGMTRNAALDLGRHGIRVNSISPGYLDHVMDGKRDASLQAVVPRIPLGRLAATTEMSGAVAFLASEDASFITGIDILIDGGMHLG